MVVGNRSYCAQFRARSHGLSVAGHPVIVFAYPAVCRDIPNQLLVDRVGIYWFCAFTLIALCSYAAGDLVTRSPLHAQDMLPTELVSTATI